MEYIPSLSVGTCMLLVYVNYRCFVSILSQIPKYRCHGDCEYTKDDHVHIAGTEYIQLTVWFPITET